MEPIAYTEMTDGTKRTVFLDDGHQFILDGHGVRVFGERYVEMEPEHYDVPTIVGPPT